MKNTLLIGSYTPKDGSCLGFHSTQFESATGALSSVQLSATTPNPTFLVQHPNRHWIYAVSECTTAEGKAGGAAAAFQLGANGILTPINVAPTGGGGVSHIAIDATGRVLVTVSYSGSQIVSFPVAEDGSIGARQSSIISPGQPGPNAKRQDKSHPHSTVFSPDNRRAYVCDLGLDRIFCFDVDHRTATLVPSGDFPAAPGSGPRHSKFSRDGNFFYVINELDSTVATYAFDSSTGALQPLEAASTLPVEFQGENICAEVQLHPNGQYLYGSNRGHDSIAVFARDSVEGGLTIQEIVPSGGKHPRHFALSPDGHSLVCANRDSNNLVSFQVDPTSGRLIATGQMTTAVQAVCVLFLA